MRVLLFFALGFIMFSCFEQGDCSDVSSHKMQVNFYNHTDSKSRTILLDSIKMLGWDTVMYEAISLSNVALPLNPDTDSMRYVLYYSNTQQTLDIKYGFKTFALAPECNAIDLITLKKVTTTVDTALIIQPKLTSTVVENIKLYF